MMIYLKNFFLFFLPDQETINSYNAVASNQYPHSSLSHSSQYIIFQLQRLQSQSIILNYQMSRSRLRKSKGAQTPLFIQKLIEMLQDSSINHIISWTTSNDSFQIKSISQFTQTILPRFFKHNNFSSFIRQLNMYGFRKVRHQDGQNVYENESFKKGNRNLLKNIKRKVNLERQDRVAIYTQEGHSNHSLNRQIQEMKNKQKDLEQICRHLLLQNHKLIEENNSLMKKFKDEERRKQRKIEQLLIAMIAANQNKQPAITGIQNNRSKDSQPHNLTNMLSIMTGENESDLDLLNQKSQQTPLEVLTNALSRNKSMKQFKQMLQNYYNSVPKQRNQSNYHHFNDMRLREKRNKDFNQEGETNGKKIKFNHQQSPEKRDESSSLLHDNQSSGFHFGNDPSQSIHHVYQDHISENTIMKPVHEDQQGFISINDFMNLEEEKPIIEDQQGINLQQSN